MSQWNTAQNRPLIPNVNDYLYEKKYVSIQSDDRNIIKYPNSSEFTIQLPQDYLNVQYIQLASWAFPANYSVFSVLASNLTLYFKFDTLYDPRQFEIDYVDLNFYSLQVDIYNVLNSNIANNYSITIEIGFYNPTQMATELTNKMNECIQTYLATHGIAFSTYYYYSEFVVIYNTVGQRLWFGNRSSSFTMINDSTLYASNVLSSNISCTRSGVQPSFSNWGLPAYLGFFHCNVDSTPPDNGYVRFYYDDTIGTETGNPYYLNGLGIAGVWLYPNENLPGATVSVLTTPQKINFMGPSYIYMELEGYNCIDETVPFNVSSFTSKTNQTNGVANSCFAKIPIPTTPISQWFDNDMKPYKWFDPPAERITTLTLKFRFHNGLLADFGNFEYSILLEFNLLRPCIRRNQNITTFGSGMTKSTR
jgi:hypothetical protein